MNGGLSGPGAEKNMASVLVVGGGAGIPLEHH